MNGDASLDGKELGAIAINGAADEAVGLFNGTEPLRSTVADANVAVDWV